MISSDGLVCPDCGDGKDAIKDGVLGAHKRLMLNLFAPAFEKVACRGAGRSAVPPMEMDSAKAFRAKAKAKRGPKA